eukprot:1414511-Rhodomonas_salina.1
MMLRESAHYATRIRVSHYENQHVLLRESVYDATRTSVCRYYSGCMVLCGAWYGNQYRCPTRLPPRYVIPLL